MAKSLPVNDTQGNYRGERVECPGCGGSHYFDSRWAFNGDRERPTFSPSMLEKVGHHASRHKPGDNCWCTYNAEHPGELAPFRCGICHSFVRDGRIEFLPDCTHTLAGQTVDLPDIKGA